MSNERQAFEVWLRDVDHEVAHVCGLGYSDLPDIGYHDLFDCGATPREAAVEALLGAGFPEDLIEEGAA